VQACPTGQVWSSIKNACSACDTGKHVRADLQICVCNTGTTADRITRACVPCPTDAIQETDRCYCPANLALDIKNNACKACPTEAPIRGTKCKCTNTTLLFNQDTWTCTGCPGTFTTPRRGRPSCTCGANQILYERNASCYTCPAGTIASGNDCRCAGNTGLVFDYLSGKCVCKDGKSLNTTSGVCTVPTAPLAP
jgi:hypothetical protein